MRLLLCLRFGVYLFLHWLEVLAPCDHAADCRQIRCNEDIFKYEWVMQWVTVDDVTTLNAATDVEALRKDAVSYYESL